MAMLTGLRQPVDQRVLPSRCACKARYHAARAALASQASTGLHVRYPTAAARAQSARLCFSLTSTFTFYTRLRLPRPRAGFITSLHWREAAMAAARAKFPSEPLTDSRCKRGESPMEEQP